MKKIFLFLSCLAVMFSCAPEEPEQGSDSAIELAKPKITVTTKLTSATISWTAVQKTAGYAYKIDNGQETTVAADVTNVTVDNLSKGEHTAYVWCVGDETSTLNSLESSATFTIDPKLQAPQPTFKVSDDLKSVTFSWDAVEGATGYAYKIGDNEEINVGSDVTSFTQTGLRDDISYNFYIYAVGSGVIEDSEKASLIFALVDLTTGAWVKFSGGSAIPLKETETGIWTATANCSASCTFTIVKDGTYYGFTTYSGNGGIGTVNSKASAVPLYTYETAKYYVRQSLGQMTSAETEEEVANKFWVNMDAACSINIKIDATNGDGKLRYYLDLVQEEDPSVILEQYFDLMVFGGDWTQEGKSRQAGKKLGSTSTTESVDGTEPGDADASYTTFGFQIGVPDNPSNAAYIANRGLTGWDVTYCYEFPGYIRISNSTDGIQCGVITTPALEKLSSGSTITVTFDMVRFASSRDVPVKVLGSGTITSASVLKEGTGGLITITPEAGNKSIKVLAAHTPKHANADIKPWSKFTMTVEGAGPDTKISWDTSEAIADKQSSDTRICLDNIVIKKN